jgi:uncharacterized protein DUF4391
MDLKLPKSAHVNKFIAKTKFYEKASLSSKLQNEFINKIQKITWKYKLSESTVGINKTDDVTEIQIFEIELKEKIIPKNVLKVIDKAIPYQILYRFIFNNDVSYGITLKGIEGGEQSAATNYYFSAWDEVLEFDFSGIDLEKVYQKLIKAFIKNEVKEQSSFKDVIDTDNSIKQLEKEIVVLGSKISKEKQFNRKVELNKSLLDKQQKLNSILDAC